MQNMAVAMTREQAAKANTWKGRAEMGIVCQLLRCMSASATERRATAQTQPSRCRPPHSLELLTVSLTTNLLSSLSGTRVPMYRIRLSWESLQTAGREQRPPTATITSSRYRNMIVMPPSAWRMLRAASAHWVKASRTMHRARKMAAQRTPQTSNRERLASKTQRRERPPEGIAGGPGRAEGAGRTFHGKMPQDLKKGPVTPTLPASSSDP
mmetsp:Transcript_72196/g.223058  ORF Transcript_72196/g.223058 Transcript_72196/m.223058 type:complete len:211 (+) Transcript_72196:303-935(+)